MVPYIEDPHPSQIHPPLACGAAWHNLHLQMQIGQKTLHGEFWQFEGQHCLYPEKAHNSRIVIYIYAVIIHSLIYLWFTP